MAEIIWTAPALDDVDAIAEYITINNLSAAQKLVKAIFKKVERLKDFPESGKRSLELENLGYREITINPCRVFYKIEGDNVFILHVMRQERDVRRFLLSN